MINSLSIVIADKMIGGIVFTGEWWKMIVVGAVFGSIRRLEDRATGADHSVFHVAWAAG